MQSDYQTDVLRNILTFCQTQMGPGNMSCEKVLLHSDRLMVVYNLYSSIMDIWEKSNCISESSSFLHLNIAFCC